MLYNFKLCRHKFYNRFQMSPCIEGYGENIVYESKNCCKLNLYTFLLKNQKLSFSVNRINLNYGEEIKLTKSEKLLHSYKVLGEWKSTRGHFHLGQIYNSEQRTDAVNQKSSCLKQVSLHYGTFGSTRVEWYGWHTGLTILQSRVYYHPRNNIKWYGWHTGLTILKSRDTITFKTTSRDITGKQDVQSYLPECNVTRTRFGNIFFKRVHGFRVQIMSLHSGLYICENEHLKLVVHVNLENSLTTTWVTTAICSFAKN